MVPLPHREPHLSPPGRSLEEAQKAKDLLDGSNLGGQVGGPESRSTLAAPLIERGSSVVCVEDSTALATQTIPGGSMVVMDCLAELMFCRTDVSVIDESV